MAWLRQILANELAGAFRKYQTEAQDMDREPLQFQLDLDASSDRLHAWVAADQTSPSQHVSREEDGFAVARRLPNCRRTNARAWNFIICKAIAWPKVAQLIERGEEAVVGLLYRGLKNLRQILEKPE